MKGPMSGTMTQRAPHLVRAATYLLQTPSSEAKPFGGTWSWLLSLPQAGESNGPSVKAAVGTRTTRKSDLR